MDSVATNGKAIVFSKGDVVTKTEAGKLGGTKTGQDAAWERSNGELGNLGVKGKDKQMVD